MVDSGAHSHHHHYYTFPSNRWRFYHHFRGHPCHPLLSDVKERVEAGFLAVAYEGETKYSSQKATLSLYTTLPQTHFKTWKLYGLPFLNYAKTDGPFGLLF